jgi:hypothetical protein
LLGVLLAFVAIRSMYALQTPSFSGPDEAAHLAYAHGVADLSLPEIDDPQPVPPSAVQWTAELDSAPSERHRSVWVANHPPLHYLLVAPLAAIAAVIERPDGGLLFLRLANVSLGAVGIALTYFLATELTGLRRIALLAAAAGRGSCRPSSSSPWRGGRSPRSRPVSSPPLIYRHRDQGTPAPQLLQVLPTDAFWRAFAGCWIVIGCAVALAGMTLALLARPELSRHTGGVDGAAQRAVHAFDSACPREPLGSVRMGPWTTGSRSARCREATRR